MLQHQNLLGWWISYKYIVLNQKCQQHRCLTSHVSSMSQKYASLIIAGSNFRGNVALSRLMILLYQMILAESSLSVGKIMSPFCWLIHVGKSQNSYQAPVDHLGATAWTACRARPFAQRCSDSAAGSPKRRRRMSMAEIISSQGGWRLLKPYP